MHPRLPSHLSRSALAGASALGLIVALGAGTAASAAVHPAHGSASARATALAFLKHLKIGDHATNHAVIGHAAFSGKAPKQVTSTNWSGYADDNSSGTKYSKLAGKWTEPTGKCGSKTSLAAFWVGIDGYSTGTVEQDGTLIECISGTASYFTWWEMYPSNAIQVVGQTLKPGDKIAASVVKSGTSYTLKVTDSTHTANSFTKKETCAAATCTDGSAEWIAEAPSGSNGVYPLTNFGTWSLSGGTVTGSGKAGTIKSFPDDAITMVNGTSGATEAKPGPLNAAGNAFTVTWKSA
jgi:peptidase A4-like protein